MNDERPEYNPEDAPLFAQHVDQETYRVRSHDGTSRSSSPLTVQPEAMANGNDDANRPISVPRAPFAPDSSEPFNSLPTRSHSIDHALFLLSSWYSKFKGHTPRSVILRLDGSDMSEPGKGYPDSQDYADWLAECQNFVKWLLADGLVVPDDAGHFGASNLAEDEESSEETSSMVRENDDDEGQEEEDLKSPSFPLLTAAIAKAIDHFDGSAFPKLNWSAPQDGTWIALTKSCRIQTPADLYLLLKASNFVTGDLNLGLSLGRGKHPERQNGDSNNVLVPGARLELVFKPFLQNSINPALEFRCFVKDMRLVAIGQRDREFHSFLSEAESILKIRTNVHTFWKDIICPRWTSTSDYVFDVYLGKDMERVLLLDFNPFDPTRTDSGVWTWEDIRQRAEEIEPAALPEFRSVQFYSGTSNLPGSSGPKFAFNHVPRDVIDLSQGLNVAEFQERWSREIERAVTDEPHLHGSDLERPSTNGTESLTTKHEVDGAESSTTKHQVEDSETDTIPGLYAIGALASSSGFVRYLGGSVLAVAAQIMKQ